MSRSCDTSRLSRSCDSSTLSRSCDRSRSSTESESKIPVSNLLFSGTAGIDWTNVKMIFLLFFYQTHFYCSVRVRHRAAVEVSGIQVIKVKVQPGAHLLAPGKIHACLKKVFANLFLQIFFGATVAWGSFKPMKAADCPVAGSRTTVQNSLGAGT